MGEAFFGVCAAFCFALAVYLGIALVYGTETCTEYTGCDPNGKPFTTAVYCERDWPWPL